jgi:tripartite-type tricarboxylate transporter receptor subunit TctC
MRSFRTVAVCGSVALALSACGGAGTDDGGGSNGGSGGGEQPLAGETIDFAVPYAAGGGFDLYARLLAPPVGEELDADFIVRNEPGAGGLVAANATFTADADGSRIMIADTPGMLLTELSGDEGARFDSNEFSWIARVVGSPEVVLVSEAGPIDSAEDLVAVGEDKGLVFSSVGVFDSDSIGAQLVGEVLGVDVETVTGFDGTGDAFAAVLRGDTDAMNMSAEAAKEYVDSGEGRVVAILDTTGNELHPDVPPLSEVADAQYEELISIHGSLIGVGRTILGPPDMPEDVLQAYRDAFWTVLNDEEVVAKAAEQGYPIDPLTGEEVADLVAKVVETPNETYMSLIERAGEAAR